jgi:hypothetical protein
MKTPSCKSGKSSPQIYAYKPKEYFHFVTSQRVLRPELTKYTDDARSFIAYFREEKEQNLRNSRLSAVPEHVASKLQLQVFFSSKIEDLALRHNETCTPPYSLFVYVCMLARACARACVRDTLGLVSIVQRHLTPAADPACLA